MHLDFFFTICSFKWIFKEILIVLLNIIRRISILPLSSEICSLIGLVGWIADWLDHWYRSMTFQSPNCVNDIDHNCAWQSDGCNEHASRLFEMQPNNCSFCDMRTWSQIECCVSNRGHKIISTHIEDIQIQSSSECKVILALLWRQNISIFFLSNFIFANW